MILEQSDRNSSARGFINIAGLVYCCAFALEAGAIDLPACDPPEDQPMAPFERLVGGEWELDGSRQRFTWSLNKTLLKNQSWFGSGKQKKLVSEGLWYWHPAEKTLRGHFAAIEMPVAVFEYKTCFAGDTIVNQLRSYGPKGTASLYQETWEFQGPDQYLWRLYQDSDEPVMQGLFRRVESE